MIDTTYSRRSKMTRGLYTSTTDEWATPQPFFDKMDEEFGFTLDACATPANAKCARYFTREDDAFGHHWDGVVWMNPPYGRGIARWIRKAYTSSLAGAIVVCLLPARVDTAWFHDYCLRGEIRFLRGRLNFRGGPVQNKESHNAPFPQMIVVFRPPRPTP